MFNISEFRANLDKNGIYKTSNFEVIINQGTLDTRDLVYRCQSTDLPGRSMQTLDLKTAGPIQKIVYESIFTDITLNFICSADLREKDFFEKWQDIMVGEYREASQNSPTMFDIGYFDNYIGTIKINTFDETGEKKNSYTLIEAYPTSVGNVSLSWQNNSEIAILPVTFTFTYFRKG